MRGRNITFRYVIYIGWFIITLRNLCIFGEFGKWYLSNNAKQLRRLKKNKIRMQNFLRDLFLREKTENVIYLRSHVQYAHVFTSRCYKVSCIKIVGQKFLYFQTSQQPSETSSCHSSNLPTVLYKAYIMHHFYCRSYWLSEKSRHIPQWERTVLFILKNCLIHFYIVNFFSINYRREFSFKQY